jgi:hypothetical protein
MLQSKRLASARPVSLRSPITSIADECRRTGDVEARAVIAACAADAWSEAKLRPHATPSCITRDQRERLVQARAVIGAHAPGSPESEAAVEQVLVILHDQVAKIARIRGGSLSCITHAVWILGGASVAPLLDEDEILEVDRQSQSRNDLEFAATKATMAWFGKLTRSSNFRIARAARDVVAAADGRLEQIEARAQRMSEAEARRPPPSAARSRRLALQLP